MQSYGNEPTRNPETTPSGGAQAQQPAPAEETVSLTDATIGESAESSVKSKINIPTPDELLNGGTPQENSAVAEIRALDDQAKARAQLQEVTELAKKIGEMDMIAQIEFGSTLQNEIVRHQRGGVQDFDEASLKEIKELTAQQLQEMEEMQIGSLDRNFATKLIHRFMPDKAVAWVESIKDSFESVSDMIDAINGGLAKETHKLKQDFSRIEAHIDGMNELVDTLTLQIAALEVYLEAREEKKAEIDKKLAEKEVLSRDDRELEGGMVGDLARLASRLSDLKGFRLKCYKSARRHEAVQNTYLDVIESIQSLQTDTRLSFQIASQEAISAYRLKQGNDVVEVGRGFNETLQRRSEELVDTELERSRKLQEAGNQDIKKLKESVARVAKLESSTRLAYEKALKTHKEHAEIKVELEAELAKIAIAQSPNLESIMANAAEKKSK